MIYSVLDVETTGLSAAGGDRILEIGIVQLKEDGTITAVLDTLVNPEGPVTATHVHGIDDQMVVDAPLFRDILPTIDNLLADTVISAHNAGFDLGFLKEEYRRAGVKWPFIRPACTLIMARKHLADLSSKSLDSCRCYLGISDDGSHNALADAMAAARLLRYFIQNHGVVPEAFTYPKVGTFGEGPELFDDEPCLLPRSRANGELA